MRRGATLLEVLIAVAIVAVLVALILPAIQQFPVCGEKCITIGFTLAYLA